MALNTALLNWTPKTGDNLPIATTRINENEANALWQSIDSIIGEAAKQSELDTLSASVAGLDLSGIATNASAITALQAADVTLQSNIDAIDLSGIATNATAITGLQSSKEDDLSNPTVDGQALVSTIAGVRSWITLPGAQDISGIATNATAITALQAADVTLQANIDAIDISGIATNATAIASETTNRTNADTALQAAIDALDIAAIDGLQTALDAKEANLSNPASNGQVLASTTLGVRSWVDLPDLTANTAAIALNTTHRQSTQRLSLRLTLIDHSLS